MRIKSWFMNNEFNDAERYAAELALIGDDFEIERETEKAMLIKFYSDFGNFKKWIPKSVIDNEEAVAEDVIIFEVGDVVVNPAGEELVVEKVEGQFVYANGKKYFNSFLKIVRKVEKEMVKREWLINDLENYVIETVAEYTVEDQKLFAKDNSFASLKLNDLLADIDSICENILKDPAAAEYPLTEEEFVEILEIAQDYFADKFPTRLYVADRETGTFIEEVKSVADGWVLIKKFEMADMAEDTFENDFYSIVDEEHNTIDIDEALKAEDAYADGDIIFRNISVFKNFLKDCCRPNLVDDIDCDWGLKYWLDKFTLRHGETGGCSFEVSSFDTKNGNPDTIYYDVVYHFFLDGVEVSGEDNDFDQSFDEFIF